MQSRMMLSLSGSSRVGWVNSMKASAGSEISTLIATQNLPSSKQAIPVTPCPARMSMLAVITYDAVPSDGVAAAINRPPNVDVKPCTPRRSHQSARRFNILIVPKVLST
jgi:hypothetical protein